MTTPAIHFNYVTTARAAEIITNGTAAFEPAELAGWYAYDAAKDAGYGFSDDMLLPHLDFIAGEGAVFDEPAALEAARRYASES